MQRTEMKGCKAVLNKSPYFIRETESGWSVVRVNVNHKDYLDDATPLSVHPTEIEAEKAVRRLIEEERNNERSKP